MVSRSLAEDSQAQPKTGESRLGGTRQTFLWHWQDQPVHVAYETLGTGDPVLLLPAFSTVSTRAELRELATQLAPHFQVLALDWPGFGESDRPPFAYGPELYTQFLSDFVRSQLTQPLAIVAAGHAAGYALQLAAQHPQACAKLALVAPTWRGPLAVMGVPKAMRQGVKELVRSPLIGQTLYALNTQPGFLKWMYARHVFVDTTKLTPDYIEQRHQTTQQPGARYAPAAFVTGGLDPVDSRTDFLALVERVSAPLMVVIAEHAPSASKAEMTAIATFSSVPAIHLPGTLGLAEEYGDAVAKAILPFLQTSNNDC